MQLEKFKTTLLKLTLKKVIKKIVNKIYYSCRKLKIKYKPITLEASNFYYFNSICNFLYDVDKKEQYITRLNELSKYESIIVSANKVYMHVFNILGSESKYLGEKLSWNEDFKTGFKWDNEFYKNIKIVDLNNNADVKVPWELSRFQHIFTIGKAYWITEDEKYALEFKGEIEDWIKKTQLKCL